MVCICTTVQARKGVCPDRLVLCCLRLGRGRVQTGWCCVGKRACPDRLVLCCLHN